MPTAMIAIATMPLLVKKVKYSKTTYNTKKKIAETLELATILTLPEWKF